MSIWTSDHLASFAGEEARKVKGAKMEEVLKSYMDHNVRLDVRVEDVHATEFKSVFIVSVDHIGIVVSYQGRGARPWSIPYNSLAWVQPQ